MTSESQDNVPPFPAGEHRADPLPWQKPKDAEDDPQVRERVCRIMDSPGYRQADDDPDFLDGNVARPMRLGLDYLKPEALLQQHGVEHTIVVFGSTRITEPARAQRQLTCAQDAVMDEPDDPYLQRRGHVAERLLAKSRNYEVARELGRLICQSGKGPRDCRVTLMTGGRPGMMEAANRGAFDAGAKSIGLNITLPHEQYPNLYITPELCFQTHYFAIRKLHFLLRARALAAFPGGYGTLDELFEALLLIQTRKIVPIPVVLVGEDYWRRAVDVDFLVEEGVIDLEDRKLLWYAETATEIWEGIRQWHHRTGSTALNGEDAP
ncbi:MAG: cytochrome D ubiquinol oxidase subunit II [Gammaproteobacteria bacterium (ex Lamellibrachia satsuma)]|nr:MAG: LOG family protein [Gammaproteobacteria bacterium (ex Lamellibrachia satsuma)]RRS31218.1 MAG: cytochrome D ubiquinol oxidase subunit II [Gammaproteobacteria bacterium (ex Lamellibrachia satsuma)]RRS33329.1 MAG: cytochrome D ubiquinol oxidase subunit II [Gammaproteobacteria bacterium (ex Lamellibrachia satsuma)]